MSKILTISIAAYNVASYIQTTLDSLVSSKYIDDLEIFVVDDGGQDDTLTIAKEYQKRYPSSIFPVHKENGGYGTTVNYSMEHATGKYFKLLDGDDWFDTDELDRLIEKLNSINTDVVVTQFLKCPDRGQSRVIGCRSSLPIEKEIKISDINNQPTLGMWMLCYKTSLLKKSNIKLPEKMFYTDQIFCTLPIPFAETIQYFEFVVYCYRLGRDGQSVSRDSRIKNTQMVLDICKMLVEYIAKYKYHPNYSYLLHRVSFYYLTALKTILLSHPNKKTIRKLKSYDQEIKHMSSDVYDYVTTYGKFGKLLQLFRNTDYYGVYLLKLIYPKGLPNWS